MLTFHKEISSPFNTMLIVQFNSVTQKPILFSLVHFWWYILWWDWFYGSLSPSHLRIWKWYRHETLRSINKLGDILNLCKYLNWCQYFMNDVIKDSKTDRKWLLWVYLIKFEQWFLNSFFTTSSSKDFFGVYEQRI